MSENVAIQAENLSKRYRIGVAREAFPTFREAVMGLLKAPLERFRHLSEAKDDAHDTMWALKDVSFEIPEGQVVGIIGKNGAGKSTLLKVLSRITDPTEGEATLRGRIASLLEVGTGFHPELSGRENIYLNGAILGMRRGEINRAFDDIVAFAGVEKQLDTPVKRYSSGMYVRLAFSVAAHLEPEILIVDEVLAVGDAEFQSRCLGKMKDVARSGNRTVLFVSHNMTAVQGLCERVLWIHDGKLKEDGSPAAVVGNYLAGAHSVVMERTWDEAGSPGDETVRLRAARVTTDDGDPLITTRKALQVEFEFDNLKEGARLNLSVHVHGRDDTVAFETGPVREREWHGKPFPAGRFRSGFSIPADLLNDGMHRLHLLVVEDQGKVLHREEDVLVFDVVEDGSDRGGYHGEWLGALRPILEWRTEHLVSS